MTSCLFCDHPLPESDPAVPPGGRRAYDSWQGRLWDVCTVCSRWNPVPLVLRWEILEECERASTERGTIRLSTDQLALIKVDDGELIRVGTPPRLDLVGWRYGSRLPKPVRSVGFWQRLFGRLPASPSFDYQPYGLGVSPQEQAWFASPFVESAAALTAVFSAAPLAPECPSCTRPLGLFPWDFQRVGLIRSAGTEMAEARCAFCRQDVLVPMRAARPAIRLGLSLVEPSDRLSSLAEPAAREIDAIGGPLAFVDALIGNRATLGELGSLERVALCVVLDEQAESEALEDEWRRAEEIAVIMDGELSEVPGFEAFKERVLADG